MGVIRIAVDAMGGDFAPAEIVAGAVKGARELNLDLILVGESAAVHQELSKFDVGELNLTVIPAKERIDMVDDPVQAVRSRPQASINVACHLVEEGQADGVLTMGHTGAGMVSALLTFGRIPGVERPAVIVPFLGLRDDLFLVDVGANTEVRPLHLLQFALMGSAYVEHAAGITKPRVGLISNGSEPNKGNKVGREAYDLLAADDRINFIGNIEGHTMLSSRVNVMVSDGFVGNILFKGAEGIVEWLLKQVEEVIKELTPDAGAIVRVHLELLRNRNHYANYGAATLLGVNRPIFIGHGRSKAQAVLSGMATAKKMIASHVVSRIQQGFLSQEIKQ